MFESARRAVAGACGVGVAQIETSACRFRLEFWGGLSAGWFCERVDRNAFVTHLEDLEPLRTTGGVQHHAIAGSGFHQRSRQRRSPADVVAIQIDFVDANDADHSLRAGGVGIADRRAEEYVRGGASASWR